MPSESVFFFGVMMGANPKLACLTCLLSVSGAFGQTCGAAGSVKPGHVWERSFNQTDSDERLGTYQRNYHVQLPRGYDGSKKLPLMLYFHGWCDTTTWWGKFPQQSNDEEYIFVAPVGMADGFPGYVSWNVQASGDDDVCIPGLTTPYNYTSCAVVKKEGPCNCYTCYDDVKFISDLVAALQDEFCIDTDRIVGVGASNGAMFLHTLSARLVQDNLSFRFKAIVPFYGAFFETLQTVPPQLQGVSVFAHHGDHDVTIPPLGGLSYDHYKYVAVDATLAAHAGVNECVGNLTAIATPFDESKDMSGCYEYVGCTSVRLVHCHFNTGHGFWYSYSEQMVWSFISPLMQVIV